MGNFGASLSTMFYPKWKTRTERGDNELEGANNEIMFQFIKWLDTNFLLMQKLLINEMNL